MTANVCSALPPALSAVTVTIATPDASGVNVSREPDIQRCTTPPGTARAPYCRTTPLKWSVRSTACAPPPSASVIASMLPTASGAGGTTVTAKLCSALPPAFVAVTITVAVPTATPVSVTAAPSTSTVATPRSEDSAVYVAPSPSK